MYKKIKNIVLTTAAVTTLFGGYFVIVKQAQKISMEKKTAVFEDDLNKELLLYKEENNLNYLDGVCLNRMCYFNNGDYSYEHGVNMDGIKNVSLVVKEGKITDGIVVFHEGKCLIKEKK